MEETPTANGEVQLSGAVVDSVELETLQEENAFLRARLAATTVGNSSPLGGVNGDDRGNGDCAGEQGTSSGGVEDGPASAPRPEVQASIVEGGRVHSQLTLASSP